ncbi:hypothetical protein CJ179_48075 [Rhodococcus sp. ACS1]|uniref:flavin reductase family protein n=1 Tax=Rhodococcus sp. ACS1 TaxID=2028570 RepID=UPI000BB11A8A|nr:flavin reductase family protein [Rhodococcus sp. ACS1]PBC35367.1 hypothetical protein CJ179_48075 [Rhodococcus sp. ACS1]
MSDIANATAASEIDPGTFRNVLGHFPTGVVVITAIDDGEPVGMAVGSFTSVSLDPPLVAFLPTKSSTSFPRIRSAGRFTVNVIGAADQELVRNFAISRADKFAGVEWTLSGGGSPILDRAVAWIDCDIETVDEAGDHFIVVGRVLDLAIGTGEGPLLFFRGGYGRFDQGFRTAPGRSDLLSPLRYVDKIRDLLVTTAQELGVECFANAVVGEELVIVGSTGEPTHPIGLSRIGQRMPLVAPLGAGAIAWSEPAQQELWIQQARLTAADRTAATAALHRVRQRGWSVALATDGLLALEAAVGRQGPDILDGRCADEDAMKAARNIDISSHDPETIDDSTVYRVRNVSAPVLGSDGRLLLLLSLYGLPREVTGAELRQYLDRLCATAAQSAELIRETSGGHVE